MGQMNENKLLNTDYFFKSGEETMVEFHVDDHNDLQAYADKKYPEFGGPVSVRAPPGVKPIIVFGQDEAIYNQNSTNTSHWVGPNGERPLLPKNKWNGEDDLCVSV